jgi:hypothetical protein
MPKTSIKQQETQSRWETKILRAKKVRKNWKELFKVQLALNYLDGKQRPPGYNTEEWITINTVYSNLKSQLPALYGADPYFYVKLRRSFDPNPMTIGLYEQKAKIRQSMLNYMKEELGLKSKARLAIQDGHFSFGVVKTHHTSDIIENPDGGEPIYADDEKTPLIDEDTGEPLREPGQIPINSRYKITRIHPDDFLWGEDSGPLEDDWDWLAQCIREPYEDVKKNPLFNKAAVKLLEGRGESKDDERKDREDRKKGSDVKGRSDTKTKKQKKKIEPELVVRWEIYNIRKNTWLVIAEEGDIPLLDEQPIPAGIEKHPFSILRFTLRDDSPYPIPPMSQGLDLSREYNMARSDIMRHRKRFNRKYEIFEQYIDDEEAAKLESGDDGTFIKNRGNGLGVHPIKDAPLDQMRYQELGYLKMEMNEVYGQNPGENKGIATAESATQAGILDKRLEIKEGDAMSMVIDFVKDIARKLDMLIQAHIEKDEAVRVTGPQGEFWELVRTTDYQGINGEFEYSVNVGSTIPKMPQMERASWQAFLNLLANFPQLMLSRRLMKNMAEQHHIEDEAMLEELMKIAQQMMSGQIPPPGNVGSQPGVGEDRPVSAMGGQAGGVQSIIG